MGAGRVEPAAILVAAFDVNVCGPAQVIAVFEHGDGRRAAVEPHVKDVSLFRPFGFTTAGTFESFRQQLLSPEVIPGVRGFSLENVCDMVDHRRISDSFATA